MLNLPENPAFKDSHKHCKLWAFSTSFVQPVSGKMAVALRGQRGRAGMRAPASRVGAGLDSFLPVGAAGTNSRLGWTRMGTVMVLV